VTNEVIPKNNSNKKQKTDHKKSSESIKCFHCELEGHTRNKCPLLKKAITYFAKSGKSIQDLQKDYVALFTFKGLEPFIMNIDARPFTDHDLLLDNQAAVSLICNEQFLTNIRKADSPITIGGVGKGKLITTMVGDFLGNTVYYNPEGIANILCFYDFHKKYKVDFDGDQFILHIGDLELMFKPINKFYVCRNAYNAAIYLAEDTHMNDSDRSDRIDDPRRLSEVERLRLNFTSFDLDDELLNFKTDMMEFELDTPAVSSNFPEIYGARDDGELIDDSKFSPRATMPAHQLDVVKVVQNSPEINRSISSHVPDIPPNLRFHGQLLAGDNIFDIIESKSDLRGDDVNIDMVDDVPVVQRSRYSRMRPNTPFDGLSECQNERVPSGSGRDHVDKALKEQINFKVDFPSYLDNHRSVFDHQERELLAQTYYIASKSPFEANPCVGRCENLELENSDDEKMVSSKRRKLIKNHLPLYHGGKYHILEAFNLWMNIHGDMTPRKSCDVSLIDFDKATHNCEKDSQNFLGNFPHTHTHTHTHTDDYASDNSSKHYDSKLVLNDNDDKDVLINTIEENMKKFTKKELKSAELAKSLYTILGKPSVKDFIALVKNNGLQNCPINIHDIERAIAIFGPDLGAIMGKTVSKKPKPLSDDIPIRTEPDNTILYCDLCFICGLAFFVSISKGYNLLVVRFINNKKTETMDKAIEQVVAVYKKHNVNITMIVCDGEGAISALQASIEGAGIQVEQASKNEHVATVERAIRQLKERVRSFINSLPYQITRQMLIYLVQYLTFMINNFPRSTSLVENMSPREKLTGKKLDYAVDCKLEFGDYVHANAENNIKNSMQSRTFPAICLGPVGNIQGSYYFLNLNTWEVNKRRGWVKLPLPNDIIQKINAKSAREQQNANNFQSNDFDFDSDDEDDINDEYDLPPAKASNLNNHADDKEESISKYVQDQAEEPEWDYEPTYFHEEDDKSNQEIEHSSSHGYQLRRTAQRKAREGEDVINEKQVFTLLNWNDYNMFATYNTDKAIKDWGEEAKASMLKEMKQMHDKEVFEPVSSESLSSTQKTKVLRSLMHTKRKRNGLLKSRFLADGSKQDRLSSAVDPSSPTVSTEALFITAAIDAYERRHHATVDVEGAYLHCLMVGEVLLRIESNIVDLLVQIDSKYSKFRCGDGSIIVRLKRALYGCIESARLFYENISNTLINFGYKKNAYDACVFNKLTHNTQCTVVIHVDDLKVSCQDPRGVDETLNELKKVYGNINIHKEPIIDYLGMDLDYSNPGVVKISMRGLTDQVLEDIPVTKAVRTPATVDLFSVNDESKELEKEKKEKFHSVVAKLLYMAKRARPDILTAVAFLTTRVQLATEQDWNKLERIIQYLNGTKDLALYLNANDGIIVNSFIDASFACHPDGKSHTGEMITLGGGAIISKSSKQKLVTRSSTEAELVGLADGIPTVLWTKNFLEEQGFKVKAATVHQDNKSTIVLAEKGKSTTNRTRHINIRYFFVKDRIESNDIKIVYTRTENMVADFFSKPLQGSLFEKFRDIILNTPQ
jgi:hypothetical protein